MTSESTTHERDILAEPCGECGGRITPADLSHRIRKVRGRAYHYPAGVLIPTCEQCDAVWMDAALSDLVTARMVPVEGDETARDPADGEAIRSIHDREAYVALGRSNTTPGGTDFDTLAWALSATVARVADAATEQELAQVLAWVREGEASR